jgi:hypothetical protein
VKKTDGTSVHDEDYIFPVLFTYLVPMLRKREAVRPLTPSAFHGVEGVKFTFVHLFNDSFSHSEYTPLNDEIVNER